MPHPLQQRIRSVGARARRLVLWHSAAWVVQAFLAAALAACLADYLIRYDDRGVRIIVSALVLAGIVWSVRRFWLPAWRFRLSDVEAARRIERRFPQLRDRLSSSVAFLHESEDDPRAGSADLRRAVVSRTQADSDPLDLHQALEPRPARLALGLGLHGRRCGCGARSLDPNSAALAARRLAMPWSNAAWPRWNDLAFEHPPSRLAKGENFEVELIDRNDRLPDETQIEYWFEGDDAAEIAAEPMKPLGDKMLPRRGNVTRSFSLPAVGGDHRSMPWTESRWSNLRRSAALEISLHPPAYTGWPAKIRTQPTGAVGHEGRDPRHQQAAFARRGIAIDAEQDLEIPLTLSADGR